MNSSLCDTTFYGFAQELGDVVTHKNARNGILLILQSWLKKHIHCC